MVCTVRLNLLFLTSFSIRASTIGAGKPKRIVRPEMVKVFFSRRQK